MTRALAPFPQPAKHPAPKADLHLASSTRSGVLQAAKLNLRTDDTISGVSQWRKRPASNCSKQGQHLTAYVAFEDSIISNVRNRTVSEAADSLIDLLEGYKSLPGMANGGQFIWDAIKTSQQLLASAGKKSDADAVGAIIDDVLAIRNVIPYTAVTTHEGGGHGEAKSSGILRELENNLMDEKWKSSWDEATVLQQAPEMMWRLLDYDPPNPDTQIKMDQIVSRVLGHFMSMRTSYPRTFDWLTKKKAWLFPFLLKNRKVAGMPLRKLNEDTMKELMNEVHSKL